MWGFSVWGFSVWGFSKQRVLVDNGGSTPTQ
jgi:hypothetical protein